MARFKKHVTLDTIREQKIIPLFYHQNPEIARQILAACYQGGARVVEFTNRGDFAQEVFAELVKIAAQEYPNMILGIGSVSDAATAALYMQLGANFMVSASLRQDMAIVCNRRKIPYLPGCGSLTEIGKAEELGCDIVKLFPGAHFGPGFVKAIRGPQSWSEIMVTGGVTPEKENLEAWFNSGVVAVGLGSKLIRKDWIANQEFVKITKTLINANKIVNPDVALSS